MSGDSPQLRTVTQAAVEDRLDSWKEIACYLKKEVRTVQRWEKKLGLPVRRLAQGKQGSVFAYKSELDTWWQHSQSDIVVDVEADVEEDQPVTGEDSSESAAERLSPSTGLSENTTERNGDAQPDRLIRRTLLFLLLAAAVAGPLVAFWPKPVNSPVPTKMILALRPFKNISGDPGQDFVADGLTEEMNTRLGQLLPDEMGVIPLSPAYASSSLDRIGKDLHANYVLEGSVRRFGQRVAITARLIQVSDQTEAWAESYERDLQDVLLIQVEVASAIARGVLNKVPHAQPAMGKVNAVASTGARGVLDKLLHAQPPTRQVNREAYLAYLEGRYFWSKRSGEGFAKAMTLFQKSIEIDPTYAPPYAGLADCYELLGSAPYTALTPDNAFPKAEAAARKAIELDPTLAEAHVPLGYSMLVYERNFPEAHKEFERALQLRPGYATGHQFYGYYLSVMGRLDDAIVERKIALELDPISPLLHSALGEAYYQAKRFDVTIEQNKQALELDPSYAIALVNIGRAYEQMGMHPQARAAFQRILSAVPDDPAILSLMGHEYAVSGDMLNANKILERMTALSADKYVPAIYFAVVYIGLNRKDDAFHWLDKAVQERCEYLVYLGSEPLADPLRGDPRFATLLSRIGLSAALTSAAVETR
jgi:TolB-like protein/Flp pilus assembly protein TadD